MSCGLSYSIPVGGSWNLAHICALVPESHALFIVPSGCARIIHLSAAEAGMQERFSTLAVSEQDTIMGGIEEKIIPAAEEVLRRFQPRVLFLFTSCIADFIGLDREVYLSRLQQAHPDIAFLDGRMDPINRNGKLPPIVRMQDLICSLMEKAGSDRAVNLIGSFLPTEDSQELVSHLRAQGYEVRHAALCRSLDQLKRMGSSSLNLVLHKSAVPAAIQLQQRLGIPWADLSGCQSIAAAEPAYAEVTRLLGIAPAELEAPREACERALSCLKEAAASRTVAVDDTYCSAPYALAAEMIRRGIRVSAYFADGGTETLPQKDADACMVASMCRIVDTGDPLIARQYGADAFRDEQALCLGDSAAYLLHSRHYASGLRFSGRFGYDGLRRAAQELLDSAEREADAPSSRPGRGCCA